MLVGLPGSGKSAWAKEHPGQYEIACGDDYLHEFAKKEGTGFSETWDKHHEKISKLLKKKVRQLIRAGKPFIWDQVNMSRDHRQYAYNLLAPTHEVVFVCFMVPFDVCMQRNLERAKDSIHFIDKERMNMIAQTATFPAKNEPHGRIIKILHPAWKINLQKEW